MLWSEFFSTVSIVTFAHIERSNEIPVSYEEECFETLNGRVKFKMPGNSTMCSSIKDSLLLIIHFEEFQRIRANISLPRKLIRAHYLGVLVSFLIFP
jgi:hypothetical protein